MNIAKLGPWTLHEKIGSGEFGNVNVATEPSISGNWVIKYCKIGKTKKEKSMCNTIYAEYLNYINLRDLDFIPTLPAKKFYGEDNNYRYLVMERLDITLTEYLKNIPDFKSLMNVAYNLMLDLKKLHAKRYMVNDVKPDNFMLKYDRIYFIDLGAFMVHPSSNRTPGNIEYA